MDTENTTSGGNKKFLIIFSILAILVIIGLLFYKSSREISPPDAPLPPVTQLEATRIIEAPRSLTEEEKRLIETRATTSASLTKKEKTAIGQRIQDVSGVTTLNETEKEKIEERITIQTQ